MMTLKEIAKRYKGIKTVSVTPSTLRMSLKSGQFLKVDPLPSGEFRFALYQGGQCLIRTSREVSEGIAFYDLHCKLETEQAKDKLWEPAKKKPRTRRKK